MDEENKINFERAHLSKKFSLDEAPLEFTEQNLYYIKNGNEIFEKNSLSKKEEKTIVELFCGLGGTSLGFEMAGFNTILGVDIHKPSIETFRHSHPNATAILGDITKLISLEKDNSESIILSEINKKLNGKELDVLIAGIPCQGFSLSNKKRNHLDARNYLFTYFMETVKLLKPKTVMIENVSGLRSLKKGFFEEEIKKALKELGYNSDSRILNAADYGVPQKRNRLVFLGTRIGDKIDFPKPIYNKETYLNVSDAISDLPRLNPGSESENYSDSPKNEFQKLMRGNQKKLFNHISPKHPEEVISKIKNTIPGQPMYSKYKQRIRLSWELPSPTQVSGGIRPQFQFGHPEDTRGLTVRERCRLQSIPDDVFVYGGVVQGRVQTGNAVPPLLAKQIALSILDHLNKK